MDQNKAVLSPLLIMLSVFAFGGCGTTSKTAGSVPVGEVNVSAAETATTAAALEEIECRTPGVMDSGYLVKIAASETKNHQGLHGTIATLATWGVDKKVYEGPFTLQIVPGKEKDKGAARKCYAELKAGGKNPEVFAAPKGRKSSMVLSKGGGQQDLICKFPASLQESVDNCESGLSTRF